MLAVLPLVVQPRASDSPSWTCMETHWQGAKLTNAMERKVWGGAGTGDMEKRKGGGGGGVPVCLGEVEVDQR